MGDRRGQFRIFVGNTQQVSYSDIREKFSEFGKVAEVDLKGSYGFVGFDTEEAALLAVEKMDNAEFKGRQLNVEMSLGKPRGSNNSGGNNRENRNFDRDRSNNGTVKLHVAGVGMNPDVDRVKKIFEEYGKVHEVHSIQNRDIVFVHIDEKAPELAMVGLNGQDYDGRKLKIEYGTLQDKPHYDKRAPKAKLHVANLPDCSLDHSEILRKKFDLYGSVEEAEMIKSKHIAFIRIDERYAQRAINAINNSYFFGKTIKVQFSKHNQGGQDRQGPGMMGNLPMGLAGVNDFGGGFGGPPPPIRPAGPPRFCYDDFSQLSGQRPNVRLVRPNDIDGLIVRRKRLETIHPYERQLLSYPAESRDLPPPPPEFLRLIRDRAEIKSQILLHQAELDGKLTLLSKDDDEYGFGGSTRSRSPIVPYSRGKGDSQGYDYGRSSYRSSPPKSRYANTEGGYNTGVSGISYGGNGSFESRY
ncbi:Oidioi.mRNA.OKI2018_I69.chr2.g6433.t1.cds [Oikopleura dioica]|uniref:Oidioi.mRNA.OKI2018_I69.chr2.g6433.t1.cds n=1 Tax=Oikopleura dioica TaxID=34765 RepID=A0ABN7T304_OIKDI|nr:Oidioi.mRNA.OKI2018_I69.chr2.g6433.t1.cds [Oikopleura dioica]